MCCFFRTCLSPAGTWYLLLTPAQLFPPLSWVTWLWSLFSMPGMGYGFFSVVPALPGLGQESGELL